jgi:hypothetical protein
MPPDSWFFCVEKSCEVNTDVILNTYCKRAFTTENMWKCAKKALTALVTHQKYGDNTTKSVINRT